MPFAAEVRAGIEGFYKVQSDAREIGHGSADEPPMAERRRRPGLPPRWLMISGLAEYLGHSPSWLGRECLNRRQETGLPVINPIVGRTDTELTQNGSDQYREQREQRNGPEHRQ